MPLFEIVPPSAWNEGVAFWPTATVTPPGVATVVALLAEASATASCCAWRAPDVRIDSPAKAADAFPIEATSANTSNRFMQSLLTDPVNDRGSPVEKSRRVRVHESGERLAPRTASLSRTGAQPSHAP